MSLLTDFNADCPLTPKVLEMYLRKALAEIETSKTFTFDGIDIYTIMSTANNTTIDNICSVADFNRIFEAVKEGYTIKIVIDGSVSLASYADYTEIASDNYKYVSFVFVGSFKSITGTATTKVFKFALELFENSIRLCDKSVVGIA